MKTLIRWGLAAVVVLVGCSVADAREYRVRVFAEPGQGRDVEQALKARIGASSRYAVTDSDADAEMLADIMCMSVPQARGYICSLQITAWLAETAPLFIEFGSFQTAGPTASDVAEAMFQDFVTNTSSEKIQTAVSKLQVRVAAFCKNPQNASFCHP
jgi:hypothetical protein